jgi:hypothetical protein
MTDPQFEPRRVTPDALTLWRQLALQAVRTIRPGALNWPMMVLSLIKAIEEGKP